MRRAVAMAAVLCASVVLGAGSGWAQTLFGPTMQIPDPSGSAVPAPPDQPVSSSGMRTWFQENFSVSAGVKVWLAKWQVPTVAPGAGSVLQTTTNFSPMVGPTITAAAKLRDSNWFNSAFANFTYLYSDGFDLAKNTGAIPTGPATIALADVTGDAKRRDYTISAGITVYKGIGLFAGYYNTQQRFNLTTTQVFPTVGAPQSGGGDFRIRGPLVGIFGSSALTERVGLYGNAAMGFLHYQAGPASDGFRANAQAWSSEVGLNIAGPEVGKFGTTFQIGFRAQVISIREPETTTTIYRNDITWGPTFAFMGTF